MKLILLLLGFAAALLITIQLVLGLLILQDPGSLRMRTTHQHSGYLTVVVSLIYIACSLATIASMPKTRKP
jgi:hypothetical protein